MIPHISRILVSDLPELLSWADVIVIGRPDKEIVDAVVASASEAQHIIDTVGALKSHALVSHYEGTLW